MKIITKQFGEIEFSEDRVIKFNNGLYGFESFKRFLLIKTDNELFYWLNSIDEPEIAFPLVGARILDENYLQVEEHEAFSIVTLNKDPLLITVNMKAPVYINQTTSTGYQKILDDDKYMVEYKLFVGD